MLEDVADVQDATAQPGERKETIISLSAPFLFIHPHQRAGFLLFDASRDLYESVRPATYVFIPWGKAVAADSPTRVKICKGARHSRNIGIGTVGQSSAGLAEQVQLGISEVAPVRHHRLWADTSGGKNG